MEASTTSWPAWISARLDAVRAANRWRHSRPIDSHGPTGTLDGRAVTSYASNDYLGLSTHPAVIQAAHQAIDRWGTGATASRLIVGTRPGHEELEAALAEWKGTDAALVFSSGYLTNLGVLSALADADTTIFSDELNHASLIDGCRLSRARTVVYPHGDIDWLEHRVRSVSGRTLIVSDSVFSMDGDAAPVAELTGLAARTGAALVLDEAHAVFGPDVPVDGAATVIRIGTLSKALGALGGWVAASRPVVDLLVNRARPYIFTTALTPADTAAGRAALGVLRSEEGAQLLGTLRNHVDRLVPGGLSPIVPIVVGDEDAALKAASALLDRGILVPAIRPPTVPPGSSRLRVALSAAHSDGMITNLLNALQEVGLQEVGLRR